MSYISKKTLRISKIIVVITLLQMVIVATNNQKSALGSLPATSYSDQSFSWVIDDISIGSNVWINSTLWFTIANWHANIGDEITYNISDVFQIENKDYTKGSLNIGNLSLTTNDHAIGTNLALSYYPWVGGLISLEKDWMTLGDVTPFSTNTNITIDTDSKATILEKEVNTVKFKLNDSSQQTELVYEAETGILVSGKTSAFGFNLEIHLSSSSIPLPSITPGIPQPGLICFLVSISLLTFTLNIKRKRS